MDKRTLASLVRRSKSADPREAAEARAELDRMHVQFKAAARAAAETR